MTQLRKGTAERAGLIRGAKPSPPESGHRGTPGEADGALGEARERAETERIPGGANSTPHADDLLQNPPEAGAEEQGSADGNAPKDRQERRQDNIEQFDAPDSDLKGPA